MRFLACFRCKCNKLDIEEQPDLDIALDRRRMSLPTVDELADELGILEIE